MRWIILVLLVALCVLMLICYALCVMAHDADERAKRMHRAWKENRMSEIDHTCENCYYMQFDSETYPCSMCVCGAERRDMFRPIKEEHDE